MGIVELRVEKLTYYGKGQTGGGQQRRVYSSPGYDLGAESESAAGFSISWLVPAGFGLTFDCYAVMTP